MTPVIRAARALVAAAIFVVPISASAIPTLACSKQEATSPKTWHATGVIKSFGPNRASVNIAHDDIPGYMNAMTMTFEAKTPAQLDGLAASDKVAFDFYETEDARRVLVAIAKR